MGRVSDFYHRYKEDISTMADFGLNTFRFTIQWPRLMKDPLQGIVDPNAVSYYRDVIKTIKSHGMEPIISLEHWGIFPPFYLKNMTVGYLVKSFLFMPTM